LAQFSLNPDNSHWGALKRLIAYIRTTEHYELAVNPKDAADALKTYFSDSTDALKTYVNASWMGEERDRITVISQRYGWFPWRGMPSGSLLWLNQPVKLNM
jgi:hypothetical protein